MSEPKLFQLLNGIPVPLPKHSGWACAKGMGRDHDKRARNKARRQAVKRQRAKR